MRKLGSWLAAVVLLNTVAIGSAHAFPSGGALAPPLTLVLQVAGFDGVPDDAVGVAMNVTVTGASAPGFLTVYPCGDVPTASNLNYVQDQTVPNFVVSALSPAGEVCIDTFAVVDVVVDLAGFLPAASPIVMLAQPSRIVDSRQGVGLPGPLAAMQVTEVQVAGTPGLPVDASMVLFNATVTNTETAGFLTVFSCGESTPPTSTLNFTANSTVPNFVVAKIGRAGRVCLYSTSATQILIDVAGYNPAGATDVIPLQSPARLLDTRNGIGGPTSKLTSAGRGVQLAGIATIPDTATAVLVNLTATRSIGSGFVSAYPCGATAPLVSNLNFSAGGDVANMAIVKLGTAGQLCLTANNDVDVIVDVTGYLNTDASITALTPVRIYDSRDGVDPPCKIGVRSAPNGFEIVDLVTGGLIGLAPVVGVQSPRVYVRGDCLHIDIVGFDPVLGYRGWLFDKSGALIKDYPLLSYAYDVVFTDEGPLTLQRINLDPLSTYSQVVDVATGLVLFTVPEPDRSTDGGFRIWETAGATSDGGLIALQVPTADRSRKVISYWTPDGQQVGEWTGPVGAFNFRLSPLGTYLAYVISSGSVSMNGFVVTLDGSLVTTMPSGPAINIGPWITDGSMLGCLLVYNAGLRPGRWDLFSPAKDLISGNPINSCLIAAG